MTSTGLPWEPAVSRPSGLRVGNELRAEGDGLPAGPTGNQCTFTPAAHRPLMLSPAVHPCSEAIHGDGCGQPAVYLREANLSDKRKQKEQADKGRDCSLQAPCRPAPAGWRPRVFSRDHLRLPVQQGVVQVLTQTLQDLVVVPDGGGLVFTCSKVALQLKGKETRPK